MKIKFILALLLIPLFISCGSETNTSSDDDSSGAAATTKDLELNISEDEKLDLTVNIAGIKLTGSVRVKTLTSNGSLYAYLYIPGMSATATIKGKINGSSFTIKDFDIEHELAEGSIENLKGTIDSSGNYATGTFNFLMNQGEELSGTFTIAKQGYTLPSDSETEDDASESSPSSTSLEDFIVTNHTYDVALYIAGFEFQDTTVTVTSYNEASGALKVVFKNEEYDITANATCTIKIKEESLTCNPFTISSSFVTGSLNNIVAEFNPVINFFGDTVPDNGEMGLEGWFDFKLEESDLFAEYIGATFGGTFLIME